LLAGAAVTWQKTQRGVFALSRSPSNFRMTAMDQPAMCIRSGSDSENSTNISQKWTMPIRDWKAALTRFTIQFEERLPYL
jgi:hypothetical protein